MHDPDPEARWREAAEAAVAEVRRWRVAHPRATLDEIEAAVDDELHGLRARLVRDAATAGAPPPAERPACPACGAAMHADGTEVRRLTTAGDRTIALERQRWRCPACGAGLFPPR